MTDKIRIGLIGTSGYANILLTILAACQDAEITALCGRTRSRADEVAGKYQIPQVFTDYNAMFKHGRLDGVIVAAPDDLHYPMVGIYVEQDEGEVSWSEDGKWILGHDCEDDLVSEAPTPTNPS